MISMSRNEMVQYLKDYAELQYMVMLHPTTPIGNLFSYNMLNQGRQSDNTIEYYERMRRTFSSYQLFKHFSYTEDYLLNRDDFLSNNDLDEVSEGCKFIDKPIGITNKKIVQLIRNAFNHNDDLNVDRFLISKNGRYYQVEFNDIRTNKEIVNNVPVKPVKIKFGVEYLIKVINIISEKKQNFLFLSFDIPEDFNIYSHDMIKELDKIKFVHYYLPKKISKEAVSTLVELSDSTRGKDINELLEISTKMHTFIRTLEHDVKEFELNVKQKEKVADLIKRYISKYPQLVDSDSPIGLMYYFLRQIIPVPMLKQNTLMNQIILSDGYYNNPNLSLKEINQSAVKLAFGIDEDKRTNLENTVYEAFVKDYKDSEKRKLYMDYLDGEFIASYSAITYIDAVVMHYCTDEEITINGQKYNREKIRNSFAHGRWFISKNQELIMYDADPRNVNDYNLELVGEMNLKDFWDWAAKYVESKSIKRPTI